MLRHYTQLDQSIVTIKAPDTVLNLDHNMMKLFCQEHALGTC